MRVIAFVTQKGGAGKTTLTVGCAVAAQQAGRRVLVLDLDPQGSAAAWYESREAEAPRLAKVTASDLDRAMATAREAGFDVVLIDTPGRDDPATAAAIRAADLCVVPCRPTPLDMKATPATAATIQRLGKAVAFVVMQAPVRGFRISEARAALGMLGMVAPTAIASRSDHQDAYGAGLGVTEFDPSGKAAAEIGQLWTWIAGRIEKVREA